MTEERRLNRRETDCKCDGLVVHQECTEHSGQKQKLNLMLWLMGILIGMNIAGMVALFWQVSEIKIQVATISTQIASHTKLVDSFQVLVQNHESRLDAIERGSKR